MIISDQLGEPMKKRTRPTFSPEFRLEASQLVVDQNYTVIAAAKALANIINSMIKNKIFGTYNVGSENAYNKYDFVNAVCSILNISVELNRERI